MNTHNLKILPEFFPALESGAKTFEVRKDDRGFQVGDLLCLFEWYPATDTYSGRHVAMYISYILPGGQFGIEPGFCVLGIRKNPY